MSDKCVSVDKSACPNFFSVERRIETEYVRIDYYPACVSIACCNRSSVACAAYVLVQNIISFIFAAVMIDFDRKFIAYPYFDAEFGLYSNGCKISGADFNPIDISTQLHKGQLAGAVIMLVSSLIYVSIFAYTYIRAVRSGSPPSNMTFPNRGPFVPNQMVHANQPNIQLQPSSLGGGFNKDPHLGQRLAQPSSVVCPNCGTAVATYESF